MTPARTAHSLSLWAQIWGSTFEKIHTLGTGCLALSLVVYLAVRPLTKPEAVVVFLAFGMGCSLIGWSTLCNTWVRWRTGKDQLILLRRRQPEPKLYEARVHILGRCVSWRGPLAHIDVGTFRVEQVQASDAQPQGGSLRRGYIIARALYWAGCSSVAFQGAFGAGAFLYGVWLLGKVHTYILSSA